MSAKLIKQKKEKPINITKENESILNKISAKDYRVIEKEYIKQEYVKCLRDPKYFMKNYCYIQHPTKGRLKFELYPFQEDVIDSFNKNQYNIVLKGRQIGLSTLVACYSLHKMLFHKDNNILVIATKQEVAKNLITKVRFAFENLPSWLQVKTSEYNRLSIRFTNGSQIKAVSSSGDAGRSEAVTLLCVDETAHIDNIEEIWSAAQATLSTGGGAILISTPNGTSNFFHRKYMEAEEYKDNPRDGVFYPIKLDWRVHPERDQEWRDKQDITLGPHKARQEFDAEFLGSSNTLIDADIMELHRKNHVIPPIMKRALGGDLWIWKQPDYTKSYILSADIARGENSETGDFSACHVIDTETCEQVAEYRGRLNTNDYGHLLVALGTEYNDALLIIDNSNVGWAVIQKVIDRGYRNLFYQTEDLKYVENEELGGMHLFKQNSNALAGFTISPRTRPLIIAKFQEYMLSNAVTIHSQRTLDEMLTFIFRNGKPQAASGCNDDLIMALALGLWVRDTALDIRSKNLAYTRLALDHIQKINYMDPIYTSSQNRGIARVLNKHTHAAQSSSIPLSPQIGNPYKMPIARNGEEEDLFWLL